MSLTSFQEIMATADEGQYAVGYFESWNLESLLAVADAAEATRSPVILGFSGMTLPQRARPVADRLSCYAALGLDVCKNLSVPACLLFNESADLDWVLEAVDLGFQLVMFSDERLDFDEQTARIREVADKAHAKSVAVEGELTSLPGLKGESIAPTDSGPLTDLERAHEFVERTKIDALAVEIGQLHLHGRAVVRLDLDHLARLKDAFPLPLVLHGATSVAREDLAEAAHNGIRKINVGSILKETYLNALRRACASVGEDYNPYDTIGSGLSEDVLIPGRIAMQKVVEELMRLFGSAGRA
jgi:fructose-bisphosphate aldolase, class II